MISASPAVATLSDTAHTRLVAEIGLGNAGLMVSFDASRLAQ